MPSFIGAALHNDGKHVGSAKRNAAGGVAPLNDETTIYGIHLPPCFTAYGAAFCDSDHNITGQTSGNGTYAYSADPIDITLKSGITIEGRARYCGRRSYDYDSYLLEFGVDFAAAVNGVGGMRYSIIGFSNNISTFPEDHMAVFMQNTDGTWQVRTESATGDTHTTVATVFGRDPVAGDQLTVRIGKTNRDSIVRYANYYINGILIAQHLTTLPAANLQPIAAVYAYTAGVTTERELTISGYHFIHMQ